jgi:hypothetical protein
MTPAATPHYKTTESKYKGGAKEMYVTYDLWQATRGENQALYPKSLFEKYQAASRLSIKRVIAT